MNYDIFNDDLKKVLDASKEDQDAYHLLQEEYEGSIK